MAEAVKRSRAQTIAIGCATWYLLCVACVWLFFPTDKFGGPSGAAVMIVLGIAWVLLTVAFVPAFQADLSKRRWPTWLAYIFAPPTALLAHAAIQSLLWFLKFFLSSGGA